LTSHFTISQVKVWVNLTHSLGKLITVQVKGTMTTSLSSPLSNFESICSWAQDSKVRSKIYYETFDAVSAMIHKRNQWQGSESAMEGQRERYDQECQAV
jgi:hypothetical protein